MEIVQENIPLNILTDTYKMKTSKGNRKIKSGKGWVRNTLKKIKLVINNIFFHSHYKFIKP